MGRLKFKVETYKMEGLKLITTCLAYGLVVIFFGDAYAQSHIHAPAVDRFLINTSYAPANPSRELLPIIVKGKCGFINRSGNIIVKPELDKCADFYEGLAVVTVGPKTMVIDNEGLAVFEPQLHLLDHFFSNGLIRVCSLTGQGCFPFGYLNRKGEVAIKPQFEIAQPFSEGLAAVKVNGKWGFIDQTGRLVIAPRFVNVSNFSDGLARVYIVDRGPRWVFIDKAGNVVLDQPFGLPGIFLNGFAAVKKNHGWSVMDKTGKTAFDPRPEAEFQVHQWPIVSEGLIRITSGKGFSVKWGFADTTGKIVIAPQFEWAHDFSEGLAAVRVGVRGKWGYIDKTGAVVIKPQFDEAHKFIGGIARVENGRWVKSKNKRALPNLIHIFAHATGQSFDDPTWDGEMGYIDRRGRYIWNPTK